MGQKSVTFCDVCYVEKKEVNHWFVVKMTHLFVVGRAEEASLHPEELTDVCGQACLTKLLQRWMQSGDVKSKETTSG